MLEICVTDIDGACTAFACGADRVELCAALPVGGLTPSLATICAAVALGGPVHVLVRPRAGDFRYEEREAAIVEHDIVLAIGAGARGLVIGANDAAGGLDASLRARWIGAASQATARPSLTLHRAFDVCTDLDAALDTAIALGFDQVLTSGGAARACDAAETLARLHGRAADRIVVMAGSGVDADTVAPLRSAGITAFHASCSGQRPTHASDAIVALGFAEETERYTDGARISALRVALETPPKMA